MVAASRIAVAGFGLIGRRHAEVLQLLPEVDLVGIVDPAEPARHAAEALGLRSFATLDQLFEQAAVEGVILATPTPQHVAQALVCIERGSAVLVEKPIAVTAEEAGRLVVAAETANVPLLVGHHRRHNARIAAAKLALEQGAVGTIRAVQATCWFYKPDQYFQAAPWRTRKGAGPISVNLVHDVDLLRHFCGEVVRVQAQSAASQRGFENEDLASAIMTFESGAVGTVTVSDSIVSPWSWELTSGENPAYPATQESCYLIGGSRGALSIPDLRIWRHETPDWCTPIAAETLLSGGGDPLVRQARHFARVIRGLEPPLVSGREGARSLLVVEAVQQAADRATAVVIVPPTWLQS